MPTRDCDPTGDEDQITDPVELYNRFIRNMRSRSQDSIPDTKPSLWLHYSKKQPRGMCKVVGNKYTVHPEDLKLLDQGYMDLNEVREYFKEVIG